MITEPLIVIAICIVFYGAFSGWLSEISDLCAHGVHAGGAWPRGAQGLGIFDIDIDNHVLEGFGELTLGLILFADAASTNSRRLAPREPNVPKRLLLVSLPLTILFGALGC